MTMIRTMTTTIGIVRTMRIEECVFGILHYYTCEASCHVVYLWFVYKENKIKFFSSSMNNYFKNIIFKKCTCRLVEYTTTNYFSLLNVRENTRSVPPTRLTTGYFIIIWVYIHTYIHTMGSTRESTKLAIIFPQDLKQKQ